MVMTGPLTDTGSDRSSIAYGLATAALFVVILVVSVTLAVATDLATPARWAISVVSGVASAAIVYALTSRSTRPER